MDGLLVVDKPVGPTSHDVVARVRRALREKRIGHTGTLDPLASGVLALVLGRATRLAQFMTSDEKAYDARVRLGIRTDTYDAEGATVGDPFAGTWPDTETVTAALASFVGTFAQHPPAFSAKKIAGQRSYALARTRSGADAAMPAPAAVPVTLMAAAVTNYADGEVALTLTCSAGFYVRSLAHDLGERLGTGAHLVGLRRTRSGAADLRGAVRLADLEADPARGQAAVVPMAQVLPHLPAFVLSEAGLIRAAHGARLTAADLAAPAAAAALTGLEPTGSPVKLLSPAGILVAMARVVGDDAGAPRALHPSVVLM